MFNKVIAIILIFTVMIYTQALENKLIFQPKKLNKNYKFNLNNNNTQEYNLKTKDNIINLMYFKNNNTKNFIIYAHGNGGNIESCFYVANILHKFSSVVCFDYSGYGKSTGAASEKQIYRDLNYVYKFVVKKLQINPEYITLYGFSLGSSVMAKFASDMCENNNKNNKLIHSIILEAGFCDLKTAVKDLVGYKLHKLLKSEFNTKNYIKNISNKIKILASHSQDDEIIKYNNRDILKKANNYIYTCDIKGGHNSIIYDEDYIKEIKNMLYEKN